jgi:hypothetical protein
VKHSFRTIGGSVNYSLDQVASLQSQINTIHTKSFLQFESLTTQTGVNITFTAASNQIYLVMCDLTGGTDELLLSSTGSAGVIWTDSGPGGALAAFGMAANGGSFNVLSHFGATFTAIVLSLRTVSV